MTRLSSHPQAGLVCSFESFSLRPEKNRFVVLCAFRGSSLGPSVSTFGVILSPPSWEPAQFNSFFCDLKKKLIVL